MAVKIRLARHGKKNNAFFHIVAADSRSPRDGRFIEILGFYQPQNAQPIVEVDGEKALAWMMKGAVPSDTVRSIFRKAGIMRKFHEARKPAPKPQAAAQ